jgi:hypothetical protein
MPRIDVRCTAGHEHEVMRPLAMYPATPDCPECGAPTEQFHAPPRTVYSVEPVLLFRGPDGQIRFVGDANGISAHAYAKQGFERIEIRGAAEMRRFERHMNAHEYSQAARKTEEKQRQRELRESQSRSELRRLMGSMTPFGRSLAREAMRRADARPVERTKDPGFHSDVYSNDRSNRDESRDAQGRRRRD